MLLPLFCVLEADRGYIYYGGSCVVCIYILTNPHPPPTSDIWYKALRSEDGSAAWGNFKKYAAETGVELDNYLAIETKKQVGKVIRVLNHSLDSCD